MAEHRGVDARGVERERQGARDAPAAAVPETAARIVRPLPARGDHAQEGAQHGVRVPLLPWMEHGGHAIHTRVQLPRTPTRLGCRKPAARLHMGGASIGMGGGGNRAGGPKPPQRGGGAALCGRVPHGRGPFRRARCPRQPLLARPSPGHGRTLRLRPPLPALPPGVLQSLRQLPPMAQRARRKITPHPRGLVPPPRRHAALPTPRKVRGDAAGAPQVPIRARQCGLGRRRPPSGTLRPHRGGLLDHRPRWRGALRGGGRSPRVGRRAAPLGPRHRAPCPQRRCGEAPGARRGAAVVRCPGWSWRHRGRARWRRPATGRARAAPRCAPPSACLGPWPSPVRACATAPHRARPAPPAAGWAPRRAAPGRPTARPAPGGGGARTAPRPPSGHAPGRATGGAGQTTPATPRPWVARWP
jgi:hypothetical protein